MRLSNSFTLTHLFGSIGSGPRRAAQGTEIDAEPSVDRLVEALEADGANSGRALGPGIRAAVEAYVEAYAEACSQAQGNHDTTIDFFRNPYSSAYSSLLSSRLNSPHTNFGGLA